MKELFKYGAIFLNFTDKIDENISTSKDLFCTAIARSLKKNRKIVIDCYHHACDGGSYFVCGKAIPKKDIIETYVKKEKVFQNKERVNKFLKLTGKCPKKTRYIVFNKKEQSNAEVVIAIVNAAAAGRILGLASYKEEFEVDVVPSISTCSCLFRPFSKPNSIHINFIDYFDRYHQCKGFFDEDELIISMHYNLYKKIQKNFKKSSHGSAKPELMKIEKIRSL